MGTLVRQDVHIGVIVTFFIALMRHYYFIKNEFNWHFTVPEG